MRTAQVAEQAGVNIQTLRYYERRGLLPEPERRDSGYRARDAETVRIEQLVESCARPRAQRECSLLHALAAGEEPEEVIGG